MGTMPFKPFHIDIVKEFNDLFEGYARISKVEIDDIDSEKDYSNIVGAILFILFLNGLYAWISGF